MNVRTRTMRGVLLFVVVAAGVTLALLISDLSGRYFGIFTIVWVSATTLLVRHRFPERWGRLPPCGPHDGGAGPQARSARDPGADT